MRSACFCLVCPILSVSLSVLFHRNYTPFLLFFHVLSVFKSCIPFSSLVRTFAPTLVCTRTLIQANQAFSGLRFRKMRRGSLVVPVHLGFLHFHSTHLGPRSLSCPFSTVLSFFLVRPFPFSFPLLSFPSSSSGCVDSSCWLNDNVNTSFSPTCLQRPPTYVC